MAVEDYFSDSDLLKIESAIQEAEKQTSGEIRVHLEDQCDEEVLDQAAFVFADLEMHRTELRNGVLIYVAIDSQKLAIIGDRGIHQKVGDDFWKNARTTVQHHFAKSEFVEGLSAAIHMIGQQLKSNFPYMSNDRNELPNEVSIRRNATQKKGKPE